MAASRMYLRVRWFTDVTAGSAISAATSLALLLLAGWARPAGDSRTFPGAMPSASG